MYALIHWTFLKRGKSMKKALVAVFSAAFICAAPVVLQASEGWISLGGTEGAAPQIRVVAADGERTVLEIEVGGFSIRPVEINGKTFSAVSMPGATPMLAAGLPDLPRLTESIIIPDLAHMSLRVLDMDTEAIPTIPIAPSKGNLMRNVDPASVPYTFDPFYQTDAWYPAAPAELGEPFIVRDFRGTTVLIHPVRYNPHERSLLALKRLVIEIAPDGPGQANLKQRMGGEARPCREFTRIYERLFVNYTSLGTRYAPVDEPGRMVIITYDDFFDSALPLYLWKLQRGIPAGLMRLSEVGSTAAEIKAFLLSLYESPQGLTYIVLVGDSGQIPTLSGTAEGAACDPCFVKLEGIDHYPDAFISRISAQTADQVDTQVSKLIDYERDPDTGAAAAWYHKGIGIASSESGGTGLRDWERADLLRDDLLAYTYTEVDQVYDPGASESELKVAVNDGRSIINYIGHGSGTSWSTTGFSSTDAGALENGTALPFIIDVACLNGAFKSGTCFAEAWLRAGAAGSPKGAIGMYSASTSAAWVPPCVMQAEAVRLLVEDERNTLGGLCFNGVMAGLDAYPGYEGTLLMEQYNLFGDCSLVLRTDEPEPMTVYHLPILFLGLTFFDVEVDAPGALVSLYGAGVNYGAAYADTGGAARIELAEPFTEPGEVTLTVTAYNKIPYTAAIQVIPADGPYLIYDDHAIDDSAGNGDGAPNPGETVVMPVELFNVGTETGTGVAAGLSTESPYVTIHIGAAAYPAIAPEGTEASASPHFVWTASPAAPDRTQVRFTLAWTAAGGHEAETGFTVEICTEEDGDGFASCLGDCDDDDPAVNPDAVEVCDGVDNNCDGTVDEGFVDPDGDGWAYCVDCDETDPDRNPGTEEVCDGKDNDCDLVVPPGEFDDDGDRYVECEAWVGSAPIIKAGGDCDDTNPDVNPGVREIKDNGIDDDCDGEIDEGLFCFIGAALLR